MGMLECLRDLLGRGDWIAGLCHFVPGGDRAPLDGRAIPVLSARQRARIPESWLENLHRSMSVQSSHGNGESFLCVSVVRFAFTEDPDG
jgi:hypothetical protein